MNMFSAMRMAAKSPSPGLSAIAKNAWSPHVECPLSERGPCRRTREACHNAEKKEIGLDFVYRLLYPATWLCARWHEERRHSIDMHHDLLCKIKSDILLQVLLKCVFLQSILKRPLLVCHHIC